MKIDMTNGDEKICMSTPLLLALLQTQFFPGGPQTGSFGRSRFPADDLTAWSTELWTDVLRQVRSMICQCMSQANGYITPNAISTMIVRKITGIQNHMGTLESDHPPVDALTFCCAVSVATGAVHADRPPVDLAAFGPVGTWPSKRAGGLLETSSGS